MKTDKSGQAMVEFIGGLVGVVVIISMLLQINLLSSEHLLTVVDARSKIGDLMLDSSYSSDGKFLSGWEAGPDGHAYSVDDTAKAGSSSGFVGSLMNGLNINELDSYMSKLGGNGNNRMSDVVGSSDGGLIQVFDTANVSEESEPVQLLPGVRRLVYDAEEIQFTHKIYMPWINNLME